MLATRAQNPVWLLLGLLAVSSPADAQHDVYLRGKVLHEDGSVPDHMVTVQRVCYGMPQAVREAVTSRKTGEYVLRLFVNELGQVYSGTIGFAGLPCHLEAVQSGFISSRIDLNDRRLTLNPRLPDLVLTPQSHSATLLVNSTAGLTRRATRSWELAVKRLAGRDWEGSDAPLRATVIAAPKFAPAWAALGGICVRLGKVEEARQALERAVELDPKQIVPYQMLVQAQADLKDWKAVAASSEKLIALDSKHTFLEAYLYSATALYQLRDFDHALARIDDAIRLDRLREFKRATYIRGVIQEAKGDYAAAEKDLRGYLAENPRAQEAAAIHARIEHLGKGSPADLSGEMGTLDLNLAATGESLVPGGLRAFSTIAQLARTPAPHDFFLDYCRTIIAGRPDSPNRTSEDSQTILSFISTIAALENLGARMEHSRLIRVSTAGEVELRRTRAVLAELGWKLVANGEAYELEGAGRPDDALRQRALAGLGVDEFDLRSALREKRELSFEIPMETARLVGGAAWSLLLKGVPEASGGPTEIFLRDKRFARVYCGLGGMEGDSAAALVSSIGLANLIVKYSAVTARFANAIEISGHAVAVPVGAAAEPVWAKLVGAKPQAVAPFLRALFEKDQGRLLAFYHALAHADARHQQFFTRTPERAEAFYQWYRGSIPAPGSVQAAPGWQEEILQSLRIDDAGQIQFPGGRQVWAPYAIADANPSDDDLLLRGAPLEALSAIAIMEQRRGVPLSGAAVPPLVRHFDEWRHLYGYFEQMPGLDEPAFHALEDFSAQAAKAPLPQRNVLLGEWHALVELIVLGSRTNWLNSSQASEAFQQACSAMRPSHSAPAALAVVRSLTGGAPDLDEALISRLLRLTGPRRKSFEQLRKLLQVPLLGELPTMPGEAKTLRALSGIVYAALLDPAYLLVAEDPQLLSKHQYVTGEGPSQLFPASALRASNKPEGSRFEGGFASFQQAALPLRGRTVGEWPAEPATASPASSTQMAAPPREAAVGTPAGPVGDTELVFQAQGRVVEAYATVTDSRGRYADDLEPGQFSILEEGEAKPVFAFESHMAGVTVALVFDTSGSMATTLPRLKSAALQLLDELRPVDSAAVYTFDDAVSDQVPFTQDKEAAKRAILKLHACGVTALYEALVRVNHDLAARAGKKVIVVFTDGADNASMLSAQLAIEKAKQRGVPIYTIAQGEALFHPELVMELNRIAQSTGGVPFLIHKPGEIAEVFEKISQDLIHGYLLAFQPAPGDNRSWRRIKVVLKDAKGLQVRAREGYYVE